MRSTAEWIWWVRDLPATVRGPARAVLFALASRADKPGRCHSGLADLARIAGVSKATAKRGVCELERLGLVRVDRSGRGRTNHYVLTDRGQSDPAQSDPGHSEPGVGSERAGGGVTVSRGWGQTEPQSKQEANKEENKEACVSRARASQAPALEPWAPVGLVPPIETVTDDPPDGVRLMNALGRALKDRRQWTHNEQRNAVQLIERFGIEACLQVAATIDVADSPVAMLRRRLDKSGTRPPGGKKVRDMTDQEYADYVREMRRER